MPDRKLTFAIVPLAVVALVVGLLPAAAQYDRDGRYVPSPNGVPADPYARPVPLHPGTPGGAVGEPVGPRVLPVPPVAPLARPPVTSPERGAWVPREKPVAMTLERCRSGWSKATRLTPTEFRRRCRLLLKKDRTTGGSAVDPRR